MVENEAPNCRLVTGKYKALLGIFVICTVYSWRSDEYH